MVHACCVHPMTGLMCARPVCCPAYGCQTPPAFLDAGQSWQRLQVSVGPSASFTSNLILMMHQHSVLLLEVLICNVCIFLQLPCCVTSIGESYLVLLFQF